MQVEKISDDDSVHSKMRDSVQGSLQSQVPSQDYELDILPRYKEALHIGLAPCKEHFRNKVRSTTSVFRAMSAYGPLPHIIGSEEYNHDNSCGLADDVQPLADDFSWLREFQGVSSDSGAADLFESQMLGVPQGFEKGKTDTLVSAAREFKAMFEAALVNPFKFYDDASIAAQDVSVENTSTSVVYHNTDPVMLTGTGEAARERSTEADTFKTGLLASLQNTENDAHGIYSAWLKRACLILVMRSCLWIPWSLLTLLAESKHQVHLILQLLIQLKGPSQQMKLQQVRWKFDRRECHIIAKQSRGSGA